MDKPEAPFTNCLQAANSLRALVITRQRLSRTECSWRLCESEEDKVHLINNPPPSFQLGRFKSGPVTDTQRHDLCRWVRLREQMNFAVSKPEVLRAIAGFDALNKGTALPESFSYDSDITQDAKVLDKYDNAYRGWLDWQRQHLLPEQHVCVCVTSQGPARYRSQGSH